MDFDLTEEQKMLKTNAREFLEKEIVHIADEYDRKELSGAWAGLAGMVWLAGLWSGVAQFGTETDMAKRLVPRMMAGELIGCGGITEPNVGSNAQSIETTATLDGDEWVINGTKTWISNGQIADLCLVLAVTDKSKGPLGISMILAERECSPYGIRELHKLGLKTAVFPRRIS